MPGDAAVPNVLKRPIPQDYAAREDGHSENWTPTPSSKRQRYEIEIEDPDISADETLQSSENVPREEGQFSEGEEENPRSTDPDTEAEIESVSGERVTLTMLTMTLLETRVKRWSLKSTQNHSNLSARCSTKSKTPYRILAP
jgi:hypothetical protein